MQSQLRQIHSAHRPMPCHGHSTQRPQHLSRCVKTNASAESSQPKRILITGGNQGIGFQTARQLSLKGHDVVIACRDPTRAREAIAKIKEEKPGALVSSVPLDLGSLASVRDCAACVMDDGRPLDVLLNNAGVMATPKMQTQDGFEFQLGTNHLGHFTLTNLLLPALVDSKRPVRIIFVASEAHKSGSIKFDDLMRDKPGAYVPWEAYGQSKLANIMTTYELAKRLQNHPQITVNALHPGLVRTELGKYMLKDPKQWWMVALFPLASAFFKSVEEGAATSVYLAASPDVEKVSSKYFVDCKPANSSPASYDTAVARKLWEVSQELTKVDTLAPASVNA